MTPSYVALNGLPRSERIGSRRVAILLQHFDGAIHNLLLIPVDAFEGCCDTTLSVKDVSLNAVPVYQRLDEVDPQLEVTAKRFATVRGS